MNIIRRCRRAGIAARRAVGIAAVLLWTAPALAAPEATSTQADAAVPPGIESAVVKIFATVRPPDLAHPWSKQAPAEISGSGVVIDGKRILTNAHVVGYASQIQVQGSQGGDRLSAKVAFIAPGIDLALLTLDDERFFESHPPIARSSTLPTAKDSVLAYGYPKGGQSLSVTRGIVSRTEFTAYNFPVSGMRVQIDAAINPGNSGGPAVVGDRMIGLAFSRLGDAQNIGYIIPNEEIDLFLQDVADGHYDGKPALFDSFQTLENPALRSWLRVGGNVRGVVTLRPWRDDPAYPLERWDVVTRIGDTPIDDQGQVSVGPNLRVRFTYLVQKVANDGSVPLTVNRHGRTLQIRLPVASRRPMLMPDLGGAYPPYFIYGPVVFSIATQPLAQVVTGRAELASYLSLTGSPLITERGAAPSPEHQELVVIPAPLFPHPLARGYASHALAVLQSVNGTPVRSLRHLVELLRDLKDDDVVFDFAGEGVESMVFPRREAVDATESILADNGVRAQGSPELMAIWNAKAH